MSKNTEDGTLSVLYRPLYYTAYLDGVNFLNRPLEMFMEDVPFQGMKTPRFSPVKDEKVLAELRKIREEIYGR